MPSRTRDEPAALTATIFDGLERAGVRGLVARATRARILEQFESTRRRKHALAPAPAT